VMLGRACMTSENINTYAIFISNDLISCEWGVRNIFSSYEGGFAKIVENHWFGCSL